MRWGLIVCFVAIIGCGVPSTAPEAAPGVAIIPGWHTGGPVGDDEMTVARYIETSAVSQGYNNPKVTWLEWGPHDLDAQTHWNNKPLEKIFRVRYQIDRDNGPPVVISGLTRLRAGIGSNIYTDRKVPRDWMAPLIEDKARERKDGTP